MDRNVDGDSSATWGGRTAETSAVAAELQRLDAEMEREFGSVELDGSGRSRVPPAAGRVAADRGPYRGNVESRTIQAEAELRAVTAKLAESRQALKQLQLTATAAQDKSNASHAELEHVVGVISQVLQKIAEQEAGGQERLTPEIRAHVAATIAEPVEGFFFQDSDPVTYIDEKISNMSAILDEWPDMDADSEESKQARAVAANTLSFLSQVSEDEALAAMTDAQAEPTKDHKINSYEGVYRLHIVSEPPEEVTNATRTAGVEFDNGEFFMLGIYHSYDGQRPAHETKNCNGRRVRVFAGEKYSLTPAKDDDDLLSILTPYIANVSGIELVE